MYFRFLLSICFIIRSFCLFSQPSLHEQGRYFEDHSFSKISLDETGIWAISGDSSKVYHYDLGSTLQLYPQFNVASTKKFTGILAKGTNKVMVATAGDFLLSYDNGVITKLEKTDGILNGNINSLYGDQFNTIVGTDSLAYMANGNLVFTSRYSTTPYWRKRTYILGNVNGNYWYPWAQKNEETGIYYLEFDAVNSIIGSYVTLDYDEYPRSLSGYYNASRYLYVATNKGLKFFNSYNNTKGSLSLNIPTYCLYQILDKNYNPYIIVATKNGLFARYVYPNYNSVKVLDNLEVYDILCISNRIIWLATNKGLIQMSIIPQLTSTGVVNLCESSPQNLEVKGTMPGDNIEWYRNNLSTGFFNVNSISILKGGTYYAVISNVNFAKADTTEKVIFKTDSVNYSYTYSYDTITICKGGDWTLGLNSINYKKYIWLKDGEKIADQQSTLSIFDSGNYSVLITNCNNLDAETKRIKVKTIDLPNVNFNYPKENTICTLDTVKLMVSTNADDFLLTGPNYYFESIPKDLNLFLPGTYVFNSKFKNIQGCSRYDTLKISLLPLPYAKVEQSGSLLKSSSLIRNSDGQVKLSFKLKDYQWFLNNKPIVGSIDSVIYITNPGNYKVRITDFNGCSNFSNTYSILAMGTSDIEASMMALFPNPSNGIFTISGSSEEQINRIDIFNTEGLLVKSFEGTINLPYRCNLSCLNKGLYLVQIVSKSPYCLRVILY